jgi:carboxymethylenebutenolidase
MNARHWRGACAPVVEASALQASHLKIRGKILYLFGKEDPNIPQNQVQTIKSELEKHHIRHEVVIYDGANHGFFCDQRGSYNATAAADAWGG